MQDDQGWQLDQLGNWEQLWDAQFNVQEQTRGHNAANEITSISMMTNPVHDAAGNMTTMPQPDGSGSYTTTYDAWNRMIEVVDGMTTVLTNEYDGNHHRIQKVVNGGDTFDYYYNDRWQMTLETVNGSAYAVYAWHLYYIDALAVRMRAADQYYFLHDANFNVTAAYDITSGSGTDRQVVERYAYTPYGEVTFLDGSFGTIGSSAIDNYHLYTGRERDPETGLQLNRNRFYHALLGRWLTRDPIGYLGGLNCTGPTER